MPRRYVNQLGHQEAGRPGLRRRREATAAQPQRQPLPADGAVRPHRLDRRPDVERHRDASTSPSRTATTSASRGPRNCSRGPCRLIATELHKVDPAEVNEDDFTPAAGRGGRQAGGAAGRDPPRHDRPAPAEPGRVLPDGRGVDGQVRPGAGRDQEPPRLPGRAAGARGQPDGGRAAHRPLLSRRSTATCC